MEMPRQRLPLSKKTEEWRKQCVTALIDRSSFSSSIRDRMALYKYYDAYYGKMDDADYSYVTNPYQTTEKKYLNFPAKLRNYNIIQPVVDLRLGEMIKRPKDWIVTVKGADTETVMQEEIRKEVIKTLRQEYINELNAQGIDTGIESAQTEEPEHIAEKIRMSFKDWKAITGQDAIDYITQNADIDDKVMQMWFDWLVTGMAFSYRGVENGEVVYERISPFDIDFDLPEGKQFVEDESWITSRRWMSANDVIDRFYDLLTEDDIDSLEHPESGDGFVLSFEGSMGSAINHVSNTETRGRQIEVIHTCWKSYKKIGFLYFLDELGEEQMLMVDESYRPDKVAGERIEWKWINEWWEGWRINGNLYKGIKPLEVQRRSMTNISECKPPYNGRIWTSLVATGMNYQLLYNIFHYRLEKTIAKNKDKIALMEINMLPKRHGWTEEKFMYYADATGFAFIDSTGEGKNRQRTNFNQWQVLDMSLGNYIAAQFSMLQAIKEEWEERAGAPRARRGQVMASDSVGVTERSVFQAALITEEGFRRFEKLIERDMRALMDVSKYAWEEGKKEAFVTRDGRDKILSIGKEYRETEYGIFIKNAGKEKEKFDTMKNLALAFAQNDASPAKIAEILDATSFTRLKVHLQKVEETQKAFEKEQIEQQQRMAESERAARKEELDANIQAQKELEDAKHVNSLEIEQMKIDADRDKTDSEAIIEREKIASNERIAKMSSEK